MSSATGPFASRRAYRSALPRPSRRPPRRAAAALGMALAVLAVAGLGGALAVPRAQPPTAEVSDPADAPSPAATAIPVPSRSGTPAVETAFCDRPEVQAGLAARNDAAVIAAAGGGEGLRQAVTHGVAPCIDLRDPSHVWFVVNKAMPMNPIDFAPADRVAPDGVPLGDLAAVRADIAPTVTAMSEASVAAGTGQIGMQNGYRDYASQQRIHSRRVGLLGKEAGERLAARPGYSEHQSGIAMDVFACAPRCSSSEQFGSTATYQWVLEHAWEFGWIIRYEDGRTPVTGYHPEEWHLRYIGPELAAAYRAGGFHTLEEFFGLPPAPHYLD